MIEFLATPHVTVADMIAAFMAGGVAVYLIISIRHLR